MAIYRLWDILSVKDCALVWFGSLGGQIPNTQIPLEEYSLNQTGNPIYGKMSSREDGASAT